MLPLNNNELITPNFSRDVEGMSELMDACWCSRFVLSSLELAFCQLPNIIKANIVPTPSGHNGGILSVLLCTAWVATLIRVL